MRRATTHWTLRSTLVGVAVTATSLGVLALPAQAADSTVNDLAALQAAATSCADGDVVTLGADVTAASATITTTCTMTLDLNGRSLAVAGVVITPGTTLTIDGGVDKTGSLTAVAKEYFAAGIRTTGASLIIESGVINANGYQGTNSDFELPGGAGIGGGGRSGSSDADAGTVTVNDGTVTATAGQNAAGIGGGIGGNGGITIVNGGTVTATGDNSSGDGGMNNSNGAGIGGGVGGNGGTLTIDGGTVQATGGLFAAGIGGGNSGDGGITTIGDGAHLTATGGMGGAGIGGGPRGAGGTTTIEQGADVTASGGLRQEGGTDIPAIGPGVVYEGVPVFGTLSVSGILRIPTSANLTIPADATAEVTSTGLITGLAGEADGGQIFGPGTIANAGSIALPDAKVIHASTPATVTDHHYVVSFDTQVGISAPEDVTVFAASFADGKRAFPEAPTAAGLVFVEWNSQADGSGVAIDADSTLPGAATGGPLAVTAYAQFRLAAITGLAAKVAGTPREGRTLTANPGTVTPATATYAYRWYADGKTITGATAKTLKLAKAQAGRRISVRITATVPGNAPKSSTSAWTNRVSSPYKRILVSDWTIKRGQKFVVTATGFASGQRIRIWLGGRIAYAGRADSVGTVRHTVKFSSSIQSGTRRVRVSGYNSHGTRTGTILTRVTYRR